MALLPGSRLGPYEILAALAAGGMGEVYKGRDTRLDCTVAISIAGGMQPELQKSRKRSRNIGSGFPAL